MGLGTMQKIYSHHIRDGLTFCHGPCPCPWVVGGENFWISGFPGTVPRCTFRESQAGAARLLLAAPKCNVQFVKVCCWLVILLAASTLGVWISSLSLLIFAYYIYLAGIFGLPPCKNYFTSQQVSPFTGGCVFPWLDFLHLVHVWVVGRYCGEGSFAKNLENLLTGGRVDYCLVAMFRKFGGLLVYLAGAFFSGCGLGITQVLGSTLFQSFVLVQIKSLCLFFT